MTVLFLASLLWGEIQLVYQGALHSQAPFYRDGPKHLSAASGLCKVGDELLVVPDDGTHLLVFSPSDSGAIFPLLSQEALPKDAEERKEAKPDFESLTRVGDDFLALGSGSSPARTRGVLFRYSSQAGPGLPQEFDLGPLYRHLQKTIPGLNIEGLAALEEIGILRLAHRGQTSRLIDLDLAQTMDASRQGQPWTPEMLRAVTPLKLGLLRHVPLGITDLTPLSQGRCAFSAAAEDTEDPREDGVVTGSTVGILSAEGEVLRMASLDRPVKVEGIVAEETLGGLQLVLVTDADDPAVAAELFSSFLPFGSP